MSAPWGALVWRGQIPWPRVDVMLETAPRAGVEYILEGRSMSNVTVSEKPKPEEGADAAADAAAEEQPGEGAAGKSLPGKSPLGTPVMGESRLGSLLLGL